MRRAGRAHLSGTIIKDQIAVKESGKNKAGQSRTSRFKLSKLIRVERSRLE